MPVVADKFIGEDALYIVLLIKYAVYLKVQFENDCYT